MTMLWKNPLVRWLLVANTILMICFAVKSINERLVAERKQRERIVQTAEKLSHSNLIKKDDYIHLATAGKRMHDTGRITDDDLTWCLGLLGSNPNPTDRNGKVVTQIMVTDYIGRYVKKFTPHQEDVLFDYFVKAMRGDGGNAGNEYFVAINFMHQTKDPRVIPIILPFKEDSNPSVREAASDLIEVVHSK